MSTYGKNVFANENVEIKAPRPSLTEWDIRYITGKYGATEKDNETYDHQEAYTEWQYGVATWYFVYFCDDGIHARKGLFSDERTFMDYDTLREDDTTMSFLQMWFDDYPGEFYNMLWELHEA